MTKGRVALPWRVVAKWKTLFITRAEPTDFFSATSLSRGAALPFVISTEAQRSGEISVWGFLLEMLFDENNGPRQSREPSCVKEGTSVVRVPHRRRWDEIRCAVARHPDARAQKSALAAQLGNASAEQAGNAFDCWQALYKPHCCCTSGRLLAAVLYAGRLLVFTAA